MAKLATEFRAPRKELERKFRSVGMDVIIGVESVRGPNTPVVATLEKLPECVDKRHLNSGVIIGTARVLRRLFTHSLRACPHDDQIGVGSFVSTYPSSVFFDIEQRFVLHLNFGSEVEGSCCWVTKEDRFSYKGRHHKQMQHRDASGGATETEFRPAVLASAVEYPVFIHTPFVSRDLGFRDRYVRGHLLSHDAAYQPRSRMVHCSMAVRHILKLTSTDPVYRRLALSIFVSMVGAVALSFCLSNGHENAFWGCAALALMLTGKGSCLSIICSQHVQYIIEVFSLLTGLECLIGFCTWLALKSMAMLPQRS